MSMKPRLDIVPAEPDLSPDPEASRAHVVVALGVDGLDGDVEVVGEFLDRHQALTTTRRVGHLIERERRLSIGHHNTENISWRFFLNNS